MKSEQKVLVVGSINVDFILYVENMPCKGETIFSKEALQSPGGKGNNLSFKLKMLGSQVTFVGAIGRDVNGEYLRKHLDSNGLSSEDLIVLDNSSTGFANIVVDQKGANYIIVTPGANSLLNVSMIKESLLKESGFLVMSMENPLELVRGLFEKMKLLGKKTVLNFSPGRIFDDKIFMNSDFVVINEIESLQILDHYGLNSLEAFASRFEIFCVIRTLGKNGADYLIRGQDLRHVSTYQVNVVDTTGAGDAFLGSFLASYLRGNTIADSVLFGCKGGSLAVTTKGSQKKMGYDFIQNFDFENQAPFK